MKKLLLTTLSLSCLVLMASCEKDGNKEIIGKKLPVKIAAYTESRSTGTLRWSRETSEFEYDELNRFKNIKRTTEHSDENLTGEASITAFTYDGENMTTTMTRPGDGQFMVKTTYVRDGQNIMVNTFSPIRIDGDLRATEFDYDDNGNVSENENYALKYDQRNGVFGEVKLPSWYMTTQMEELLAIQNLVNNCTEGSREAGSGLCTYTNKYNKSDYPVTVTRTPVDALGLATTVYTIEYLDVE